MTDTAGTGPHCVTVTAIMACYNAASSVTTVLDDMAAASAMCPDVQFDVLVVDDGSTDGTAELAEAHQGTTVLRQPQNNGVCAARERGLAAATGEYVWFVDADDRVPVTALTAFTRALNSPDVDVVIGKTVTVAEGTGPPPANTLDPAPESRRPGREALTDLLQGKLRGQLWDKLIRRSLLDLTAFTGSKVHSDVPITAAALAAADTVVCVDELVYVYVVRGGSIIGSSRRRADSVMACSESVLTRAREANVDHRTVAYFRAWFIGLSLYRDVAASDYNDTEARRILAAARSTVSWSSVATSMKVGPFRRTVSLALAALSGGAFISARKALRVQRRPDRAARVTAMRELQGGPDLEEVRDNGRH